MDPAATGTHSRSPAPKNRVLPAISWVETFRRHEIHSTELHSWQGQLVWNGIPEPLTEGSLRGIYDFDCDESRVARFL
jgi:hypothetical protein